MDDYGELVEDSGTTWTVANEISREAYQAGYGQAILELQEQASGAYWGDKIVAAANQMSGADLFGDPFASAEPEVFE